jgi:hypothetical protein
MIIVSYILIVLFLLTVIELRSYPEQGDTACRLDFGLMPALASSSVPQRTWRYVSVAFFSPPWSKPESEPALSPFYGN